MKITTLNRLVVVGLLCVAAQTALGQGTFYTSRSAFEALLGSSTTITFQDLTNPPSGGIGASSFTASGVTFTSPDTLLFITYPGVFYPIPGDGRYLWHWDGRFPVNIFLPEGVTAFGADFSGGIEPNPSFNATLTVNLAGGSSYAYNFSAPRGSWTFFGVTFPEPIASLVYRDAGPPDGGLGGPLHGEMLAHVTYSTIPEPSLRGLFALGGLFLGGLWRRKQS